MDAGRHGFEVVLLAGFRFSSLLGLVRIAGMKLGPLPWGWNARSNPCGATGPRSQLPWGGAGFRFDIAALIVVSSAGAALVAVQRIALVQAMLLAVIALIVVPIAAVFVQAGVSLAILGFAGVAMLPLPWDWNARPNPYGAIEIGRAHV